MEDNAPNTIDFCSVGLASGNENPTFRSSTGLGCAPNINVLVAVGLLVGGCGCTVEVVSILVGATTPNNVSADFGGPVKVNAALGGSDGLSVAACVVAPNENKGVGARPCRLVVVDIIAVDFISATDVTAGFTTADGLPNENPPNAALVLVLLIVSGGTVDLLLLLLAVIVEAIVSIGSALDGTMLGVVSTGLVGAPNLKPTNGEAKESLFGATVALVPNENEDATKGKMFWIVKIFSGIRKRQRTYWN